MCAMVNKRFISRRNFIRKSSQIAQSVYLASITGLSAAISACGGGGGSNTGNTSQNGQTSTPSDNSSPSSVTLLPVPALDNGTFAENGTREFTLNVQSGESEILKGISTATLGYNGNLLGPTLRMRHGENVSIAVSNSIDETTTVHWHGMHVPALMDGGPHQTIAKNETWVAQFTVLNEAAMVWYHPHTHGKTGSQVYRGLAGLIIVDDDISDNTALPRDYGIDDIPLVIQDRRINPDGSLAYMTVMSDKMGMKGDHIIVNGVENPLFKAPAQWVRFRILNGSNARIYNLGFSDERSFYRIGTDGGYLERPMEVKRQILAPGERIDVVVDFSADLSSALSIKSYSSELPGSMMGGGMSMDALDSEDFEILSIQVDRVAVNEVALPSVLTSVELLSADAPDRVFTLERSAGVFTINGKAFDSKRIDERVSVGATEIWEVINNNGMPHPFHVHAEFFQILSRDGVAVKEVDFGWKDTVLLNPFETVRIIVRFQDFPDPDAPYMFHCHILEHEDNAMMGQFVKV